MYTDKKSGKKRVLIQYHQPREITDQENNLRAMAISQTPAGFKPFDGPVIVCGLDFIFPPLRSFSQRIYARLGSGEIIYKTTKPDLNDNLCKGLFDALQGIIYLNDSQICEKINTRKIYGFVPGIKLEVEGFYENAIPHDIKNICQTKELAL